MKGHLFTWEKSRGTNNFVEERLDHALANPYWFSMFHTANATNLEVVNSDHSALFLNLKTLVTQRRRRFRFENSWTFELECKII